MQFRWLTVAMVVVVLGCNSKDKQSIEIGVDQKSTGASGLLSKLSSDGEETSEDQATVCLPTPSNDESGIRLEASLVDASKDGFETELLGNAAGLILKKLGGHLIAQEDATSLEPYVDDDFESRGLRQIDLESVYSKDGLTIFQGADPNSEYRGVRGLDGALRELGSPFDGREFKFKFKIDRVSEASQGIASTSVIYLAMGTGKSGNVQQNARWDILWNVASGMNSPRLLSIQLVEYEEGRTSSLIYSDCTESMFAKVPTFDKIRYGIDQLWGRIDAQMGFSLYGDYTTAVGDVNNDGLDDVYICQPGGIGNMLLVHNYDHTVSDISAGSGVNLLNDTPSALFVDLDNDGNQDLVIGTMLFLSVMKGDGKGGFVQAGEIQTFGALSISSTDYNNDGALDLYICRYSSTSRSAGSDDPIFDSNKGLPNLLLRNEGLFQFTDVTEESGMDVNNRKFSFSSVWEDYDNDGDMDVYVANDFGRNNLYQNTQGHFIDVAESANAEDRAAGMGVSWADFNLDGNMDLYVSNMFSSAGGRIIDKPRIVDMAGQESVEPLQRFAKGNTLLQNNGDGTFQDVSSESGITMGRWSWGGEFVDINNDSWPDIVVPNGFVTNTNSKDL